MSNQKKRTNEAAVREIRRRTRRKFSPDEKASPRTSTTAEAKIFLKRARSSWLAIRSEKRPLMKWGICAARTGSSRKSSPRSHSRIGFSKKV
jgi:hypothetical protein